MVFRFHVGILGPPALLQQSTLPICHVAAFAVEDARLLLLVAGRMAEMEKACQAADRPLV